MSNTNFTKIGFAFDHKTKDGRDCLKLKLDSRAFVSMPTLSIYKGIYIFKSKQAANEYVVCAPTDSSYQLDNKIFKQTYENKEIQQKLG